MTSLVSALAAACINHTTVPFYGRQFEVTDLRLEVMSGGEINGEIILLDTDGDNNNRMVIEILKKENKNEPTRDGGNDKEDAPF